MAESLEDNAFQTKVVLDAGTGLFKAGYAGEDAPRACFPTLLGWPRQPGLGGVLLGAKKDNYVGHHVTQNRGLLSVRNPVRRGRIADWDDMEKIWHHTFYSELTISPEEHPVLMCLPPGTSRAEKERLATTMFETFNVPAFFVADQCVMSLYSTGRTTGVVVDSGEGQTNIVPVYEGYSMPHNWLTFPIAGQDLTAFLRHQLRQEGYPFSSPTDWDVLKQIKASLCYVCTQGYEHEVELSRTKQSYEREYKLPDGATVVMSQNRFEIPEALFQPSLLKGASLASVEGLYSSVTTADLTQNASTMAVTPELGLHEVLQRVIVHADSDTRAELLSNVVLAGGNTLFPKLDERIHRELTGLFPKGTSIKVVSFPERQYAAWIGGSLLGSLYTFPCMWVSKAEYDDYGTSIVHRKC